MPQCVFKSCKNNARKNNLTVGVSYFRFPSDPYTCAEWISIVASERRDDFYTPAKNSVICSDHFDKSDISGNTNRQRLHKTAVPKLQSQERTSFERTKASMKRKASPPPRVLNQSFKSYKTTPKPSTSGTTDIQDSSGPKDLSEFDITGMSVTKKLSKMDPVQAIYAESIINNVLRRGLLKNLTEATDLCDNNCNSRVIRTPLFVDLPSNSYGHEHADSPHSNQSSSDINIKEEF